MKVKTLKKLLENVDPERTVYFDNGNFVFKAREAKELYHARDKEYNTEGQLLDESEFKDLSKEDRKCVKITKAFVIF